MTTLTHEQFATPDTGRQARLRQRTRASAADELAGRTVWCVTGLAGGRPSAGNLRSRLDAGGVACTSLEVVARDGDLQRLAERLDEILRVAAAEASPLPTAQGTALGTAANGLYAEGQRDGEALLGAPVASGDVVVLHDALSAVLAQAVRERGAHAVWDVTPPAADQIRARDAWDFLRRYTAAVDAFLMTWREHDDRGRHVERVAAVMPSADVVATKELPVPDARDQVWQDLGWSTALADVVRQDREEHVGGRRHARPAVAVR